jgi:hypothetical protein
MRETNSMRRSRAAFLALAGACALCAGTAAASAPQTLRVPSAYATVQAAVDAAHDGDTVFVEAGTYVGTVSIADRTGLSISGAPGAMIVGDPGLPAIDVVRGARISIGGLSIDSTGDGIRLVSTTQPTIREVHVTAAGRDGIRGENIVGTIVVDGNRIDGAKGGGIDFAVTSDVRADALITGNYVTATGGDGIFVISAEDRSTIFVSGNHVDHPGGRGIRTECGYAQIQLNDVTWSAGDSISVYRTRSECDVKLNTISDSGGAGIAVEDTPSSVVSDNRISRTQGDGVSVAGPAVFIRGNTIADAGAAGVRVTEVGSHQWAAGEYNSESIGQNVIARPHADGIVIVDGIGITVDLNQISEAAGTAIVAAGSELTVTENAIHEPAGDGILVDNQGERGGVVVTGNKVSDAGSDGVDLGTSDGVMVLGNQVDRSGECGFRVGDGADHNRFKKNVATDCGSFGLMEADGAGANVYARSNRFGVAHHRARHHHRR